jgi:dihydrofolate synthase/folylpolyglutamate synthase
MENNKRDQYWVMARPNRYHGLQPLREACAELSNPQDELKIIHVAGTNGKGSTVNYIRACLNALGFHTGTFTSPHLDAHFDRIRIDDEWIDEEVFNQYLEKNMGIIEKYDLGMFEIDTLIAFEWFRDSHVDYAVIETGLGGRLDNTNIIEHPLLSIITTIGFDHMAVLGNRLTQIAFEKAGIIKPYGHCIFGYVKPECERVIRLRAARMHAAAKRLGDYRDIGKGEMEFYGERYEISGAEYQKANAAMALEAIRFLGFDITCVKVKQAVAKCTWKGRFEKVSEHPDVILDGAHNEEGIRALCASLALLKKPLAIVFSALRDKPGRQMASMLEEHADLLIVTAFDYYRADTADDLVSQHGVIENDWHIAIEKAKQFAKEGTVVITGSLYFISTVREYLMK